MSVRTTVPFSALTPELGGLPELVERVRHIGREILLARFGQQHVPLLRGDHTTVVDTDAEAAILAAIDDLFDAPTLLSEERFRRDGKVLGRSPSLRVLVDPLDGTVAYNAGLPMFSISIAFELDGALEAGIVHQPTEDRSYVAMRERGAFVDGVRIKYRESASRVVAVKSSLQTTGRVGAICADLRAAGYEVEKLESSALKLCLIAEGQRAGLIKRIARAGEHSLAWGVAAGILVCREAGVLVTDLEGRPWDESRNSVVAASPEVHTIVRATHGNTTER
jgi:myo-inositol-1(or 4)-monophosphatase